MIRSLKGFWVGVAIPPFLRLLVDCLGQLLSDADRGADLLWNLTHLPEHKNVDRENKIYVYVIQSDSVIVKLYLYCIALKLYTISGKKNFAMHFTCKTILRLQICLNNLKKSTLLKIIVTDL